MAREEKSVSFKIPSELHKKFKAKCSLEGKTMQTILLELIKKYLVKK